MFEVSAALLQDGREGAVHIASSFTLLTFESLSRRTVAQVAACLDGFKLAASERVKHENRRYLQEGAAHLDSTLAEQETLLECSELREKERFVMGKLRTRHCHAS